MARTNHKGFAVIAWGSVIWDKNRKLPLSSKWQPNGPELPVEFARITSESRKNKARVTLVLLSGATLVQTYWAKIRVSSIEEAREYLADVERCTGKNPLKNIGIWARDGTKCGRLVNVLADIDEWARKKKLDGVVWTDLAPNLPTWKKDAYDNNLPRCVIVHIEKQIKAKPESARRGQGIR